MSSLLIDDTPYFIDVDILCRFLHGKSLDNKNLIPLLDDETQFKKNISDIVNEISACLTEIGAANLTIRYFDNSKKLLENTISCNKVEERLISHRLNNLEKNKVKDKFTHFRTFIKDNDATQKFASGKTYFSYQFNQCLKKREIDIQLNNHKSELARLLKENLPDDFIHLRNFLLGKKSNQVLPPTPI